MFPHDSARVLSCLRAPRTRGDVPGRARALARLGECSPHPQGCSSRLPGRRPRTVVLPAPAGMDPVLICAANSRSACSPPCGDVPGIVASCPVRRPLLPAPAGLFPLRPERSLGSCSAPRTGRDVPARPTRVRPFSSCSPPTGAMFPTSKACWCGRTVCSPHLLMSPRGTSRSTTRSCAPATRGDVPKLNDVYRPYTHYSPHSQGYPRQLGLRHDERRLLPASPGCLRRQGAQPLCRRLFPAPVGMPPRGASCFVGHTVCSLRPRGWTHQNHPPLFVFFLLPAPAGTGSHGQGQGMLRLELLPTPAGMFPPRSPSSRSWRPASRTCGDAPAAAIRALESVSCSPHPQGRSLPRARCRLPVELLPAPAGMSPYRPRSPNQSPAAPRTCGNVPKADTVAIPSRPCSPHPRGYFRPCRTRHTRLCVLPAPAGMFPRRTSCGPARLPAPRTRGMLPPERARGRSPSPAPRRPRGCSRFLAQWAGLGEPLPAPAGMFTSWAAPPVQFELCSPRLRGCSRPLNDGDAGLALLPAPAGMLPMTDAYERPHCRNT